MHTNIRKIITNMQIMVTPRSIITHHSTSNPYKLCISKLYTLIRLGLPIVLLKLCFQKQNFLHNISDPYISLNALLTNKTHDSLQSLIWSVFYDTLNFLKLSHQQSD